MQLNKLYREASDIPKEINLRTIARKFYLPTEVIIRKAGIQVPDEVRCYSTGYYHVAREILTHREVYDRSKKLWPKGNFSTAKYDEILLVEVWASCGDDGHTDHKQQGWGLTTDYENFHNPVDGDYMELDRYTYYDWVGDLVDRYSKEN